MSVYVWTAYRSICTRRKKTVATTNLCTNDNSQVIKKTSAMICRWQANAKRKEVQIPVRLTLKPMTTGTLGYLDATTLQSVIWAGLSFFFLAIQIPSALRVILGCICHLQSDRLVPLSFTCRSTALFAVWGSVAVAWSEPFTEVCTKDYMTCMRTILGPKWRTETKQFLFAQTRTRKHKGNKRIYAAIFCKFISFCEFAFGLLALEVCENWGTCAATNDDNCSRY